LDFAHWQQNRSQLGNDIQQTLNAFAETAESTLDFAGIHWPQDMQIVEIEHLSDLTDVVQCYLNSIYKKNQKYRLLLDNDKKLFAVVLQADQSVCVRYFDKKMLIRHGQLEPLKKDSCLYYTPELELDPTRIQKLEIAPFVTAQFKIADQETPENGLRGALVRGYVCQKLFDLKGESLSAHPKLFYAVKRMEQHFINRQTDSFYQDNISALERAHEMVKTGDPEAIEEAMDVLAQAQTAFEYVFAGDKLLSLLIRDLQHTLALRKTPGAMSVSQDRAVVRTPQKAEVPWNHQEQNPPKNPQPNYRHEPKSDLTN
jgi:hypothetical protein